jgi:hypothetical protein
METRKFNLPLGKIDTEKLVEEIKTQTGLSDVGLNVTLGGEVQKTVIVNGKIETVTQTIEPGIELTLNDSSKFGKALEAIEAHSPQKNDTEKVEDRKVSELEEKLLELPFIQKLIADVEALKGK